VAVVTELARWTSATSPESTNPRARHAADDARLEVSGSRVAVEGAELKAVRHWGTVAL
jgi:hypothetical protein